MKTLSNCEKIFISYPSILLNKDNLQIVRLMDYYLSNIQITVTYTFITILDHHPLTPATTPGLLTKIPIIEISHIPY